MTSEEQTNPTRQERKTELKTWLPQAWIHYANQEYEQAESLFRQALEAYPNAEEAAYGLGVALEHRNRYKEAIQALQTAQGLLVNAELVQDNGRQMILRRLVDSHMALLSGS